MERNKLILTLHYIKLAEAILKMRDPNIKTFDGNIKNYPAFKVSFSILERQGIDKISCQTSDLRVAGKAERAKQGILPGSGKYRRERDIQQERFGDPKGIILLT